jgi:hypothetical protein
VTTLRHAALREPQQRADGADGEGSEDERRPRSYYVSMDREMTPIVSTSKAGGRLFLPRNRDADLLLALGIQIK